MPYLALAHRPHLLAEPRLRRANVLYKYDRRLRCNVTRSSSSGHSDVIVAVPAHGRRRLLLSARMGQDAM